LLTSYPNIYIYIYVVRFLKVNKTAEGNNEMFQSYSDYIREADDFYSHNSVSDIIADHLKMMSFEKYVLSGK